MFVKKTQKEVQDLSPEDAVLYFEAKEAHDVAENAKAIKTATDALSDSFDGKLKVVKETAETEISTLKTQVETQKGQLELQGEELLKQKGKPVSEVIASTRNVIGKAIQDYLEPMFKDLDGTATVSNQVNQAITIKDASNPNPYAEKNPLAADPLLNVVNNVPNALVTGGVTSGVTADWLLLNSADRSSKVFGKPLLKNNILNFIDIKRLVGKILYGSVLGAPQGNAAFTPECSLKPSVRNDFRIAKTEAGKITEKIRMSEEYLKYVWTAVDNMIMPRYVQMLTNAISDTIFNGTAGFNGIVANASTYTVLPGHSVSTPNLVDVIAAHVNSLEVKEWNVGIIALNPLSQFELTTSKASDGHYDVFNRGSIQLVDGQMVYVNGGVVPIIFTNTVPAGQIFTASFDAFEVGISDELIIRMSNCAESGDFTHNIWTIILEKFCAVLSPIESTEGILFDSIANIKTLILKP